MADPKLEQRGKGWAFYVAVVLCVLVLYVLSVKPLGWLWWEGYIPRQAERAIEVIYGPIFWLTDRSPVFEEFIQWWLDLG